MSGILLSASMIVRNEERYLEGCLESIKDVVGETVIVDTGSTDRTVEIARSYGARVYEFPWNGSFADARNEALNRSRGEWILYIDADERVMPEGRDTLAAELSDPGKVAYTVRFRPVTGYTSYREHRLFRNDPRIRFTGVIHESIMSGIKALVGAYGYEIGASALTIEHKGYDGDVSHKHVRNLPLLKAQIENDPGRVYLRWQLGVTLMGMGDREGARKAWEDAIHIIRRQETRMLEDSHPYYEMIRLLHDAGEDPWGMINEGESLFPKNHVISWMKAMVLTREGRYAEAVPIFERLTAIDFADLEDCELAFTTGIFRELSYEPLAGCYYKLGMYAESESRYALALKHDPGNREYEAKLMYLKTLTGKRAPV